VNKCIDDKQESLNVEDAFVNYNAQKDFTSLEAWGKARLVKLFFYKEVIPLLSLEEKFNLNLKSARPL